MTDRLTAPLHATLHTNHGDIRLELFPDHAPKTVRNFVELAEGTREWKDPKTGRAQQEPFYDGVIFHRIIPGFMIQGGDPLGHRDRRPRLHLRRRDPPRARLHRALHARHGERRHRGAAAAPTARSSSSPSARPPWLQGKHTIFGEVADAAGRAGRRRASRADAHGPAATVPVEPVVIEKVTVERG